MSYDWAVPGAKCICIKDAIRSVNNLGFPLFKRGQIRTVTRIYELAPYGIFLGFAEEDYRHTGHIDGFRPIISRTQEQDLEQFARILNSKHLELVQP